MPPHELPANKTQSGIKSRSTPNAGPQNLNEIRFDNYMPGGPKTQYLWLDDITVWRP